MALNKQTMSDVAKIKHAEDMVKVVKDSNLAKAIRSMIDAGSGKKTAKNIKKEIEEKMESSKEEKSKFATMLRSDKIPSPPEISISENELTLVDFINDNEINLDVKPDSLGNSVVGLMDSIGIPSLTLKVGKDSKVVFVSDDGPCKFKAYFHENGNITELYGDEQNKIIVFLDKIKKILSKEEEKIEIAQKTHRTWRCDYLNTDEPEEKKKLIDDLYIEMAKSDLYTSGQLNLFYKLMHCDYDINCFSSHLFSANQIKNLIFFYENEPTPHMINFLRNFNEFCTTNFLHELSDTEFICLYNAAKENRLHELINNPNFEASFKLLGYFDLARQNSDGRYRIVIGDDVFVATSNIVIKDNKKTIVNKLEIETLDINQKPVYDVIYTDTNGVESGNLSPYINAYNNRQKTNDAELIYLYIKEFKKEIERNSKLDKKTVKLKSGNTLVLTREPYSRNNELNGVNLVNGCNIYLYANGKKQIVYSDNPYSPITKNVILKDIIEKNGGIVSEERILANPPQRPQTSPIEDQILGGVTNIDEISYNIIQEKLNTLQKTNLPQKIELSNGETIIFQMKNYFDKKMIKTPTVYLLDKDNNIKEKFIDVEVLCKSGAMSIQHIDRFDELLAYYKKIEFGKTVDAAINLLSRAQKDTNTR